MKFYEEQYATTSAGDAFIAGHLMDWLYYHKATKGEMLHIIGILSREGISEDFDVDKFARHLNMIYRGDTKYINE